MYLTVTILQLYMGDVVAADKSFMEVMTRDLPFRPDLWMATSHCHPALYRDSEPSFNSNAVPQQRSMP